MLRNLLDNAQRHGSPPIEILVGRHDGRASVVESRTRVRASRQANGADLFALLSQLVGPPDLPRYRAWPDPRPPDRQHPWRQRPRWAPAGNLPSRIEVTLPARSGAPVTRPV